jgi:hypothetical protein
MQLLAAFRLFYCHGRLCSILYVRISTAYSDYRIVIGWYTPLSFIFVLRLGTWILRTLIWDVPGLEARFGHRLFWLRILVVFFSRSRQMPGYYTKVCWDNFLILRPWLCSVFFNPCLFSESLMNFLLCIHSHWWWRASKTATKLLEAMYSVTYY